MLSITSLVGEDRETYVLEINESAQLPNSVIREHGSYEIVYEGNEKPELYLSGGEVQPVYREIKTDQTLIKWKFDIEDYAGEISLDLMTGGEVLGSWI